MIRPAGLGSIWACMGSGQCCLESVSVGGGLLAPAPANPSRRLRRPRPPKARNRPSRAASLFDPAIARRGAIQAFVKLDPRVMIRIPVMCLVEVGSVITTVDFIGHPSVFVGLVAAWLWATVLFAS